MDSPNLLPILQRLLDQDDRATCYARGDGSVVWANQRFRQWQKGSPTDSVPDELLPSGFSDWTSFLASQSPSKGQSFPTKMPSLQLQVERPDQSVPAGYLLVWKPSMYSGNDIREKMNALIDRFPIMLIGFSEQSFMPIVWNQATANFTGYSAEQVLQAPQQYMRQIFPDFADQVQSIIELIKSGASHREFPDNHWRAITAQGTTKYVAWGFFYTSAPLTGLQYWAYGIDITEQVAFEQTIKQSEERFRTISKVSTDAIWELNIQSDKLWWSEGISNLFGYEYNQVETNLQWWENQIHPDDRDRVLDMFYQVIHLKERYWQDEYRFRRYDGTYSIVYDKGFLMLDEEGNATHMIGGMTDITELRLTQSKVDVKNKQIEEYSFYNSHRLRAPLARLIGLINVLEMTKDTALKDQLLNNVVEEAHEIDRMLHQINELLK